MVLVRDRSELGERGRLRGDSRRMAITTKPIKGSRIYPIVRANIMSHDRLIPTPNVNQSNYALETCYECEASPSALSSSVNRVSNCPCPLLFHAKAKDTLDNLLWDWGVSKQIFT